MSETKTYVFGQDTNSMMNAMIPLLNQRGIDINTLLAMSNGNLGNNFGCWFIWILFLLLLWNRNGFGDSHNNNAAGTAYLSNLMNNDTGRELLMQAIQSNGANLNNLAQNLNCSMQNIQGAFNQLQNAITTVSNTVGTNGLQIINAIQSGNASIASQLAQCCCDNQLAICNQTNTLQQAINSVNVGQERGFSQMGYLTQQQTNDITQAIRNNTDTVIAGQRAAELREMQREITERDRKISEQATVINNGQQTAIFSQMIQQATTPIAAAVNNLQGDINSIKCKLPETTTIPYSPVVGIPSCVAAQYGLGLAFGLNPYGVWG